MPLLRRLLTATLATSEGSVLVGAPPAPRLAAPTPPLAGPAVQRPRAGGKFLFVGEEKFYVRGVTYGAFAPDVQGDEYHDLDDRARLRLDGGQRRQRRPHP